MGNLVIYMFFKGRIWKIISTNNNIWKSYCITVHVRISKNDLLVTKFSLKEIRKRNSQFQIFNILLEKIILKRSIEPLLLFYFIDSEKVDSWNLVFIDLKKIPKVSNIYRKIFPQFQNRKIRNKQILELVVIENTTQITSSEIILTKTLPRIGEILRSLLRETW